jgi:Mrp family chromosome partitioning ATPase
VAEASGFVALARLDHTPRDAVRRMMRIATSAGGRVLGVVATGARPGPGEFETPAGGEVGVPAADDEGASPTAVARVG